LSEQSASKAQDFGHQERRETMNTFKKTVIAIAAVSTLAVAAAAPAHAGNKWKKPFAQGLGFGVGLGIASAILTPRPQTVVVAQPAYQPICTTHAQQYQDQYGILRVRYFESCQ